MAAADHSPLVGGHKHCKVQVILWFCPFAGDLIPGKKAERPVLKPSPISSSRQDAVEASVVPLFP